MLARRLSLNERRSPVRTGVGAGEVVQQVLPPADSTTESPAMCIGFSVCFGSGRLRHVICPSLLGHLTHRLGVLTQTRLGLRVWTLLRRNFAPALSGVVLFRAHCGAFAAGARGGRPGIPAGICRAMPASDPALRDMPQLFRPFSSAPLPEGGGPRGSGGISRNFYAAVPGQHSTMRADPEGSAAGPRGVRRTPAHSGGKGRSGRLCAYSRYTSTHTTHRKVHL